MVAVGDGCGYLGSRVIITRVKACVEPAVGGARRRSGRRGVAAEEEERRREGTGGSSREMAFRRRKTYPIFSQEFVIHNHADIGFFFIVCVLIGLMFEVGAPPNDPRLPESLLPPDTPGRG